MEACHVGNGRSHQKHASDPKIMGTLSSWIRNVPYPNTQRSIETGETTMAGVAILRLRMSELPSITWECSPDSGETTMSGLGAFREPTRSEPTVLWEC